MRQKLKNIRQFLDRAKFKILLGALGLSILVIVGLGGYIVGQNKLGFGGFQAFKAQETPSPTLSPEATQAATPTPTQTPTAQGTVKVTSTSSPKPTSSPSPTPTPTAAPASSPGSIKFFKLPVSGGISFSADKTTVARGQCTKLSWNVSNAASVTLTAGSGSPESVGMGNQTKEVCPPFSQAFQKIDGENTTYTLKVTKLDNSIVEKPIVITVKPIRVSTVFNSLKVLNSAAKIFEGESKSKLGFKHTVPYNGGEWPKGGYGSYGSGEQVNISNDTSRLSPLAVNEDYTLTVKGEKDEGGGDPKYLGGINFVLSAPTSSSWNGTYTRTSVGGIGQFELTFTINVTTP